MLEIQSFSALSGYASIDTEKGVILGVSVITEGKARGHSKLVDATTLTQVFSVAKEHSGGIKVKLNHEESARLENTCGTLRNFRLDGKQLRADLHLLKSDDNYGKILELAQNVPEDFGLSLVISGLNEKAGDNDLIRCSEILSADLVDRPAANPTGLFSQPSTNQTMDNTELVTKLSALEQELTALKSKAPTVPADVTEKLTKLSELETKLKGFEDAQATTIKLAEKSAKDAILAEAARDGKKVPLTNEEVTALSVDMLKSIVSKLEKAVVPTGTIQKFSLPDKADERRTALAAKISENASKMTQYFAERGLTNQYQTV